MRVGTGRWDGFTPSDEKQPGFNIDTLHEVLAGEICQPTKLPASTLKGSHP